MDRRTPAPWEAQIRGFPVVKTYRYLGVLFDDSLSLEQELKKKKELERSLRTQMQRMNYMQLEPAARYHVWQALMKSRLWYSIVLTSRISPKVKAWMQSYLYRSVKGLMRIKGNPSTELLFE